MSTPTEIQVDQIRPGSAYQLIGANSVATKNVYLSLAGTTNQISVGTTGTTLTLSTPLTSSLSYTFPSSRGTSGYFLQTDGSTANLVWAAGGGVTGVKTGAGATETGVITLTAGTNVTITDSPAGTFTINSTGSSYTAGTGLTLTGTVFSLTNPVTVALGGTGDTSLTAYAVLTGGTTSTGAVQSVSGVGTAGQALTSNGAGALPTWQNVSGSGTVNSGTAGQLAYYATSTNAVSGSSITVSGSTITGSLTGHSSLDLALTGGTMSGAIAMGSNKITNLANGTAATDAVAYGQLQILQSLVSSTTTGDTSTTSTTFVTTAFSVSITPTSASSRILLRVYGNLGCTASNVVGAYSIATIYRGSSTNLGDATFGLAFNTCEVSGVANYQAVAFGYIDSPATTSAVTYTVYLRSSSVGNTARWDASAVPQLFTAEEIR